MLDVNFFFFIFHQGMAVFVKDTSEGWISGTIAEAADSHLVINVGNQQVLPLLFWMSKFVAGIYSSSCADNLFKLIGCVSGSINEVFCVQMFQWNLMVIHWDFDKHDKRKKKIEKLGIINKSLVPFQLKM